MNTQKAPWKEDLPRGEVGMRGLRELHAGDVGVGDRDFFGEGDDRGFFVNEARNDDDGEMFDHEVGRPKGSQPGAGAALEDKFGLGVFFP